MEEQAKDSYSNEILEKIEDPLIDYLVSLAKKNNLFKNMERERHASKLAKSNLYGN